MEAAVPTSSPRLTTTTTTSISLVNISTENNVSFVSMDCDSEEFINAMRDMSEEEVYYYCRYRYYPELSQAPGVITLFISAYLMVMFLSIFGNTMVIYTVWRYKQMHTVINYYIVNLAVSDIIVAGFVLPLKLLEFTADSSWHILTNGLCTVLLYLQPVFMFANIFTLVATCVNRYVAIVHPLRIRQLNSHHHVRKILIGVWLLPCVVSIPYLIPRAEAGRTKFLSEFGLFSRVTCFDGFEPDFRRYFFITIFIFLYFVPEVFMIITCAIIVHVLLRPCPVPSTPAVLHTDRGPGYTGVPSEPRPHPPPLTRHTSTRVDESRKKVAMMIVVVVIAFSICWAPYMFVTIVTQLQPPPSFLQKGNYFFTMLIINFMAFLHSCTNPFIYAMMSVKFRESFVVILRRLLCYRYRQRLTSRSTLSLLKTVGNTSVAGQTAGGASPWRPYPQVPCDCANSPSRDDQMAISDDTSIVRLSSNASSLPARLGSNTSAATGSTKRATTRGECIPLDVLPPCSQRNTLDSVRSRDGHSSGTSTDSPDSQRRGTPCRRIKAAADVDHVKVEEEESLLGKTLVMVTPVIHECAEDDESTLVNSNSSEPQLMETEETVRPGVFEEVLLQDEPHEPDTQEESDVSDEPHYFDDCVNRANSRESIDASCQTEAILICSLWSGEGVTECEGGSSSGCGMDQVILCQSPDEVVGCRVRHKATMTELTQVMGGVGEATGCQVERDDGYTSDV